MDERTEIRLGLSQRFLESALPGLILLTTFISLFAITKDSLVHTRKTQLCSIRHRATRSDRQ